MNSRRRELDRDHRAATAFAASRPCLACGLPAPSLPAHWPTHRGMGGGKAGWGPDEWVPLCFDCHEALDKRNGVSGAARARSEHVGGVVAARAPLWRRIANMGGTT